MAILLPLLAAVVTFGARPLLGEHDAIFFLAAVALVAWYGGVWPGLVATVLSVIAANYLFFSPRFTFEPPSADDFAALGLFVIVAVAISALSESLRASRRQIAVLA